jgi:hypothetical protein
MISNVESLAYIYTTSSAWGKVKDPLHNSFPDLHDHPTEQNTKEDKHIRSTGHSRTNFSRIFSLKG